MLETIEVQRRVAGWYPRVRTQQHLVIDGIHGPATTTAIGNFQESVGLPRSGLVTLATERELGELNKSDGSTLHFAWSDFKSRRDSSQIYKVGVMQAVANLRLLMWNLEGLRSKLGNQPIYINSGIRSVPYNSQIGGASDSMHMYGLAADITVRNRTPNQVAEGAARCGFSGIFVYVSHCHVDLRARITRPWAWDFSA